jgi:Asp-tRNA(Asn)/Glu-tRNA(Gln) amidotransferase C subunit
MIDEGLLDPMMVVTMATAWMSEDDVREMMEANELLGYAEEDEDEYEPEGTEGYTGD